jgi:hypothetical protein
MDIIMWTDGYSNASIRNNIYKCMICNNFYTEKESLIIKDDPYLYLHRKYSSYKSYDDGNSYNNKQLEIILNGIDSIISKQKINYSTIQKPFSDDFETYLNIKDSYAFKPSLLSDIDFISYLKNTKFNTLDDEIEARIACWHNYNDHYRSKILMKFEINKEVKEFYKINILKLIDLLKQKDINNIMLAELYRNANMFKLAIEVASKNIKEYKAVANKIIELSKKKDNLISKVN